VTAVFQPGRVIAGRYRLDAPIGRGGMGEVWRAYDERLDRHTALKLILSEQATLFGDRDVLASRFSRECRALARIDHPGVVAIHDAGRDPDHDGGELFLVMQLVDGRNLGDYIAEEGEVPWPQAAALGAQVASILAHVHAIPVIHRDLKPANIIVRRDGTVVLLDLGIASVFDPALSKLTRTGESLGSPAYMAPEQASSGTAGPLSDLYALGCVLYEVLTGEPVFQGPTPYALFEKHAKEKPVPIRALRPDVPAALESIVFALLAKNPEQRPRTAAEAYQRFVGVLPSRAKQADREYDPWRPFRNPLAPAPGVSGVLHAVSESKEPSPTLVVPAGEDPAEQRLTSSAPPEIDLGAALASAERLVADGKYAPAVDILAAAIAAATARHDPKGPVIRGLRTQYALTLKLDGQARAANAEFTWLAQRAASEHGPTSAEALKFRRQAAECREQAGDIAGALAEYQAILPAYTALPHHDPAKVLVLRERIGRALVATGRPQEAWPILLGLLQERERALGPQHPESVALRRTLDRLAGR
jgi:serine/threonine protein kinase